MRGVALGFRSGSAGSFGACCTVGGTATPAARKTVPQVPWTPLRSRNRLPSCSTSTICKRSNLSGYSARLAQSAYQEAWFPRVNEQTPARRLSAWATRAFLSHRIVKDAPHDLDILSLRQDCPRLARVSGTWSLFDSTRAIALGSFCHAEFRDTIPNFENSSMLSRELPQSNPHALIAAIRALAIGAKGSEDGNNE